MPHFVILDESLGRLQWSGEYASAMDALKAFDDAVGIDPNSKGLEAIADEYDILEVTAEQRAAVEAWWGNGAKASDFPL